MVVFMSDFLDEDTLFTKGQQLYRKHAIESSVLPLDTTWHGSFRGSLRVCSIRQFGRSFKWWYSKFHGRLTIDFSVLGVGCSLGLDGVNARALLETVSARDLLDCNLYRFRGTCSKNYFTGLSFARISLFEVISTPSWIDAWYSVSSRSLWRRRHCCPD